MKKFASLLSLVLVFSLCLVLVSCGGTGAITGGNKTDFSESQAKRVELRVWMDDDDGNLFSAIEKDFEAKYTNIDVVFQHMATVDAREKLKTYGQSGNGADIFQFPHDHMSQAILDDLVYQLPDDLNTKLTAQMNPVAMDIATVSYNDSNKTFDPNGEEKLYAVPISLESVALYYNIDLLKLIYGEENWEAHANPETFEAFLADIAAYQPVQIEEGVMSDSHYFAQTSHWADQYMLQFIYSAFGWRPFGANGNDDTAVGF
ncbi:MAG: extracellular solute-binding protein, partial [Turicibacter sp.]|nr:extracellular solute-binding protein [Turicibacter sp.]